VICRARLAKAQGVNESGPTPTPTPFRSLDSLDLKSETEPMNADVHKDISMEKESEMPSKRISIHNIIQFQDISKIYQMGDEETRALDHVDLSIENGEFIAVIGASGSGKSTLMHIMGLLDRPTSGSYLLEGREVGKLSKRQQSIIRNQQIGFVFQQFNLLARTTVLDNVLLPMIYGQVKNGKARAKEMIDEVGLSGRINYRSNQLSGGEIQRVAIARALVTDPSIILADEPTGNLDTKTSKEIMEIFSRINQKGSTVVLITHEQHIAAYANRTIELEDGKLISDERG